MSFKKMAPALLSMAVIGLSHGSLHADWSSAANVSSGGDAEQVRLKIDPSGNAYANWQIGIAGTQVIQSSILANGGSWTAPVDVSDPSDGLANHELAVDYSGNAYSLWNPTVSGGMFILGASRPQGSFWSSSTILSYSASDSSPRIAARYYGTAVAAWTGLSGSNQVIQSANFANSAWALPSAIISDPTMNSDHAAIGIDYNGNAIAVWESNDGTSTSIQAAIGVNGVWSQPYQLSYAGICALQPQIAVNDNGDAVAVWKQWNGDNWVIQASRLMNESWWSLPVELSYPGQDADSPQVGIDSSGRAGVVWQRYDGANFAVQASASVDGNWIPPLTISAAGEDAQSPQIAVNGSGQMIAVWSRFDGSNEIAEAATATLSNAASNPSNYRSAPSDLSATGSDALGAKVTLDSSGNSVAAWQYGSTGAYAIQAVVGTNLF